ncbi:MAG: peptidase U61 LD-carboxypeptidase A [Ignavibacteria bacterium]|nr:MAG: peptidase U61 LD-carboxypeptidase A [Ignavibacteria bacterium]KAF0161125.1 MAG: peptidase U61 LD-carboxypeptidase A [Ignavibacteria bacterium]
MAILKPQKLNNGDVIGIISPASSPEDLSRIERGVNYLQKLGYRVEVGKNAGSKEGYLAGSDQQRLDDLHYMFKRKEIRAIFCIRGGYGSGRLLDKIDYNLIRKNPKIFVGYSDITSLQTAFYTKAGLITFAGPMVAVDFYDEVSPFTEEIFWRTITSDKKIGKLKNPRNEKFFTLCKGRGSGRLLGGNLTVLSSLIGTEFFPKMKDSILMLEDINEAPYRIDRMLNQLRLLKVFKQLNGVILGHFVDCVEMDPTKSTFSLNEVVIEYFQKQLKLPVLYNVKHGHIKDNITVPFGVQCTLNASLGTIDITESAVS